VLDDTWATAPATEQARAIRDREISSRELLELYLDRVERIDPALNAVVTLAADRARDEADAADARTASGAELPPLHGLPITIKDAIETAGIRSTGGAVELRDHVPDHDAPAVARLREAGAIVFGKTNLPRWSGDVQSFNELFGTTNNPWDVTRIPGGSSGGPAAAVAAGLTSFELGTDIGGSVRIPSHCCGTFGLKPSYGVVPQRGYLDSVGGGTTDADINVFGPIARRADDLDLLLSVLAGPEPARAVAWRLELPAPAATSLTGLRLGVWLDDPENPGERAMLEVLRQAVDRLADAGAKVEEVRPPVEPARQFELFRALIGPAVSVSSPDVAELMAGSHHAWLQRDRERAAMQATWASWFDEYDALLTPVLCTTAFPHLQEGTFATRQLLVDGEAREYMAVTWWTGMFGVLGLPVAVPPVGRTAAGLPVGMQVVTPFLRDRDAVRIAGLIGDATGGYAVPPGC
jgi:amidase